MMIAEVFAVTIFRGDPFAHLGLAPLEAANEVMVLDVSGNNQREGFQPLVYRPVDVNSFDDMIEIRSHTVEGLQVHREMYRPHIQFEDGRVVARGFEETKTGDLLRAVWFIDPYEAPGN
jgi:hypothetical protein